MITLYTYILGFFANLPFNGGGLGASCGLPKFVGFAGRLLLFPIPESVLSKDPKFVLLIVFLCKELRFGSTCIPARLGTLVLNGT